MKKILLLIAVLLLMTGCAKSYDYGKPAEPQKTYVVEEEAQADAEQSEPETSTVSVTIQNFAFSPATITVKKGTAVTWTNMDSAPHTATGDGFDTGVLKKGESGSITFNEAGTFDYTCTIHPSIKGKVIVQ